MDYGEFDSDSLALSKRLQAYEKNSNNNLNDYVLSQSAVKGDEFVLELGCGRGKQSLPLSGLMTDGGGCLVSTDISSESVSKVSNILDEINPANNFIQIKGNFDNVIKCLRNDKFDLIISVYALYYTEESEELLREINRVLKTNGRFFFAGPTSNTNLELRQILSNIKNERTLSPTRVQEFMESRVNGLLDKYFSNIEASVYRDVIKFDSVETFHDYWKSHNSFYKPLEKEVLSRVEQKIKVSGKFVLTKETIGFLSKKPIR